MSKENNGGPAFPNHTLEPNPDGGQPRIIWQEGMTLRDYFAAKAMAAAYKKEHAMFLDDIYEDWHGDGIAGLAQEAYLIADEMLKAREA